VGDLNNISYADLVDMLAEYTTKYLRLMSEGSPDGEIDTLKTDIDKIVEEIKTRHLNEEVKKKDLHSKAF
jgi:hypothetical protein